MATAAPAQPSIWRNPYLIVACGCAMAVLSFLGAWNLYLWPHLILDASEHKTLSIGLKLFATTGEQGGEWGPLMATALMAALPVLLLYLVAQRQLVSAFTMSGVR